MEHCETHSAHERAIGVHDNRLDAHGKQLDTIEETLASLREIERQNQEQIAKMDTRLATLEDQPKKRWETASNYVLTAALGLLIGLLASHLGVAI